jgi:hypothetical protein
VNVIWVEDPQAAIVVEQLSNIRHLLSARQQAFNRTAQRLF